MSQGKISKKQQEILEYIKSQILQRGFPPAVREICEAVNLKSTSSVHSHLETLEKNGYIRRDPTKPRAIEILDDMFNLTRREMVHVPIIGQVAAGEPILAQENIEDEYYFYFSRLSVGVYISIHRVYIDTDLNISFSHIHNHKIFSRINFIRRKSVYLLKNFNIFFCRTIFFRKIFICDIPQSIAFFNLNTFIIDISTFVIRRILFLCGNKKCTKRHTYK